MSVILFDSLKNFWLGFVNATYSGSLEPGVNAGIDSLVSSIEMS